MWTSWVTSGGGSVCGLSRRTFCDDGHVEQESHTGRSRQIERTPNTITTLRTRKGDNMDVSKVPRRVYNQPQGGEEAEKMGEKVLILSELET